VDPTPPPQEKKGVLFSLTRSFMLKINDNAEKLCFIVINLD